MSCWALVPFKALHLAKQRLAPVLRAPERQRLATSMLQHVLDTLQHSRVIEQVAVTSPQTRIDGVWPGVIWLPDCAGELNAAVAQAAQQIWQRGATELIVLHSDLPHLCNADLQALRGAGRSSGVALAPDRYGLGTNAIYLQRGCDWTFSFGPGSYPRHLQQAADRGHGAARVQRSGFACDIDAPAELALWRNAHVSRTPYAPSTKVHPLFPHAATSLVSTLRSPSCQYPLQAHTA